MKKLFSKNKGKREKSAFRKKIAAGGKMTAAIFLTVLFIPTLGTVWVKDSRQNPQYCAACHQDPYYTSFQDPDSNSMAYAHAQYGLNCQTCHNRTLGESVMEVVNYVTGNYYYPFEEQLYPMEDTCFKCHENYEKVIPLTATDLTGAERNPHAGHWGELECGECHNAHRNSFDYCAQCHHPVTDSPGWGTSIDDVSN